MQQINQAIKTYIYLFTFSNNKASKHEHQKQGERSECICNDLSSSNRSDKTEQRQSHLMHTNECQELFEEPANVINSK